MTEFVLRKEVHVRHLQIRLVSQGLVFFVYLGSLLIFRVCYFVVHLIRVCVYIIFTLFPSGI